MTSASFTPVPRHWLTALVVGEGRPHQRQVVVEKQEDGQLFLYFWPPGNHAFISRVHPARVREATTKTLQFQRANARWHVSVQRAELLTAVERLQKEGHSMKSLGALEVRAMEDALPMTAAGTPKKRMTKDEARGYLITKRRARNQLFVDPRASKFFADHQSGLFTWTKDYVTFEFYGAGLVRKLRVKMADVVRADGSGDPAIAERPWSFAPEERDRAGASWAQTDGVLTEMPGTQHIALRSSKWERAAWNTLNAWCLPPGNSSRGVPLLQVRDIAAQAWARLSYADFTTYFLPNPDGTPAGAHMLRHADGRDYPQYYGARVAMSSTRALIHPPTTFFLLRPTSPEEQEYLAVAWDEFESTGKPSEQLRGLKRRKS